MAGASLGEGTGATMSDDDDDQADSDTNLYDGGLDGADYMGFGPLVPTETERSLMEHVRKELKHELKQVKNYIIFFGMIWRAKIARLSRLLLFRVTKRRLWILERRFYVKEGQENCREIPPPS